MTAGGAGAGAGAGTGARAAVRAGGPAGGIAWAAQWWGRARIAGWATRAWWRVHREIRTRPLADVVVPAPPTGRPGRGRGSVQFTVRLLGSSCLERALVLQRWEEAGSRPRDVVVGVCLVDDRMRAHAWLDGEDPRGDFVEIHRRSAMIGRGP